MTRSLAAAPSDSPERRRSQRKAHVVKAFVSSPTARDTDPREEATSINVSRHGVAFICRHELPAGTYHIIDLLMGENRSQVEVRVQVCRRRDDGQFQIGAQFC